jgi:hypothetical protein
MPGRTAFTPTTTQTKNSTMQLRKGIGGVILLLIVMQFYIFWSHIAQNPQKLIIFKLPRTGSSHFANLLNK